MKCSDCMRENNGIMNNDNRARPHALVSSDVTRNMFTTNSGLNRNAQ